MTREEINNRFKKALFQYVREIKQSDFNKALWAESLALSSEILKLKKEAVKQAEQVVSCKKLTNEERVEMLEQKLDAMLSDSKTSAADIKEFRDYFGLGGKKGDIIIEVVDFSTYYEETYPMPRGEFE